MDSPYAPQTYASASSAIPRGSPDYTECPLAVNVPGDARQSHESRSRDGVSLYCRRDADAIAHMAFAAFAAPKEVYQAETLSMRTSAAPVPIASRRTRLQIHAWPASSKSIRVG